jgi:hypothetical protein
MNLGDSKFIRTSALKQCEPGFHRFYSLEPIGDETSHEILVISICSNCGFPLEYRTHMGVDNARPS